eukprot:CAMPEP_0185803680 /NCGR_PEP_ID=MMETSP1322-20130828/2792_1 /TAXON_ID=265543 /ORGANISM="Minutocellus polymorphus, Strain RCC2270" /LENGTH=418 /DNA_ID=CAMNT_0028499589 /DNA_START=103 /DNA_END=1355 /DNA_ORIENTATION=+
MTQEAEPPNEDTMLLGSFKKTTPAPPAHATRPLPSWPSTIFTSVLMGLAFGLAFYKSHVFEPASIRGQFLFLKFIMLKVFFGAMGTGALLLAALSYLNFPQFASLQSLWRPTAATRGWLTGPVLGGALLGAGMAASGACPGMVLAAWGAGTTDSIYTIAGGLLGGLVYGYKADLMQRALLDRGPRGPTQSGKEYANESLGMPYYVLAAALGVVCLTGCVALEYLVPWRSEVPERLADSMGQSSCDFGSDLGSFVASLWKCPAWPPSIGGFLVGALQLPAAMVMETLLGSATAFAVCSAAWVNILPENLLPDRSAHPYLYVFATPHPKSWWQIPYVASAVVIANYASKSDDDYGGATGAGFWPAFVGGFVLIFASRLGGGCTSGHGLSGCAALLVQSWIAVPAMFAGGILTAVVWQVAS